MGTILDALFLGIVQGLTEFLPISSSGHLALFQKVLGWDDPSANLAFNIAVHLGSLGAVLVFVRREIKMALTTHPRLIAVLAVATLPLVFVAFAGAKDKVEVLATNLLAVGLCLVTTAFILFLAKRIRDGDGTAAGVSIGKAALVGIAQVLALLPGISRSGTTLVASMAVGMKREEAIRFAFLLAVPAIGGAGLLMVMEGGFGDSIPLGAMAVGTVSSFLFSLLAMKVMVGVVVRRRLGYFAIYCLAVGLLAMGWSLRG